MSSIANLDYGQAAHSVMRLGLSDTLLSIALAVIIAISMVIFALKFSPSTQGNPVNLVVHFGAN